jgi:hypothetical protein
VRQQSFDAHASRTRKYDVHLVPGPHQMEGNIREQPTGGRVVRIEVTVEEYDLHEGTFDEILWSPEIKGSFPDCPAERSNRAPLRCWQYANAFSGGLYRHQSSISQCPCLGCRLRIPLPARPIPSKVTGSYRREFSSSRQFTLLRPPSGIP